MKKIYIAGFDASLPSPEIPPLIDEYKAVCTEYECEAIFPATNEQLQRQNGKPFDTPLEEAQAIFYANLQMIDSANAIIANLDYDDNFYATSDVIFELGYAYQKGKQIIGYVNHEYQMIYHALRGYITETFGGQFGRPANLMVACAVPVTIKGCFGDCLDYLYNPKHEEDCKSYTIHRRV